MYFSFGGFQVMFLFLDRVNLLAWGRCFTFPANPSSACHSSRVFWIHDCKARGDI